MVGVGQLSFLDLYGPYSVVSFWLLFSCFH